MEYSIHELAEMAGISTRTLRYYDQISLLKPKRYNASGYRIYGEAEVDLLQQILFYRALGVELEQIKALAGAPEFDRLKALESHLEALLERKNQIDALICNAGRTIRTLKGEIVMSNKEKFAGFKKELIDENEKNYGEEIRKNYGDAEVDASNAKMLKMTQEEYKMWKELEQQILNTLAAAVPTGNPAGEMAQKTCELHKQWLTACSGNYSPEYHMGLGQMYASDPRFAAYYDVAGADAAEFFKDAIEIYCTKNEI